MSKNPLASILDQNKLTGPNFLDWIRNLKLVLTVDERLYVLNKRPPTTIEKSGTSGLKSGKVNKLVDDVCHHCGKAGHWRRYCKAFLDQKCSEKGMYFIEVNLSVDSPAWVFDTGCGSHLRNDVQLMTRSRRLDVGGTHLRIGNGARVAAEAIGTVYLSV
jgi:hypothetical protein